MSDETTTTTDGDTEGTFDLERASATLSHELFGDQTDHTESHAEPTKPEGTTSTEGAVPSTPAPAEPAAETPPPAPTVRQPPKSWAAEQHATWNILPLPAQDYIEKREKDFLNGLEQYKQAAAYGKTLNDAVAPYQHILEQQGIDAPRAVTTLLKAHERLTQGDQYSRQAAYEELGKSLGLTARPSNGEAPAPLDPAVQALQQRLQSIESTWSQQQQATLQEAKARTAKEVEVFASDPAHVYFDEVAPDIVTLIKTGLPLQEAYEKAIWANPVTRQKEIARVQTEHEAKLRENARLEQLPKNRAKSVNVRSRDTNRTPTEPLGTMEDTLKSTLAAMKARV